MALDMVLDMALEPYLRVSGYVFSTHPTTPHDQPSACSSTSDPLVPPLRRRTAVSLRRRTAVALEKCRVTGIKRHMTRK
jgi:hypothetical protein